MQNLLYPKVEVNIGSYILTNGFMIDIFSSKDTYYDWAKISLSKKMINQFDVKNDDEIIIKLGYSDDIHAVFGGNVSKNNTEQIFCKDKMLQLQKIKITSTFLNVYPTELIKYGLNAAGIKNYKLSDKDYPKKDKFVVGNKNVIELIEQIHQTWKISENFFFTPEEVFYWGASREDDNKVYSFVYGQNIISMEKEGNYWHMTTVLAPFIRHSQIINIKHYKVNGEFEIQKIHYHTTVDGFFRTEIYF